MKGILSMKYSIEVYLSSEHTSTSVYSCSEYVSKHDSDIQILMICGKWDGKDYLLPRNRQKLLCKHSQIKFIWM
jgi:hypothetical protein